MPHRKLFILLVEDLDSDIALLEIATKRSDAGHRVFAVRDGAEAIRYVRGAGPYHDRLRYPVPNVILTDLKMPGMTGFELLQWLRSHPQCAVIPTIVYTSSNHDADVKEAYRLGANAYMVKPNNLSDMVDLLSSMYNFWCRCECPVLSDTC